ncbi:MAG: ComEC/Rec2 family competence protein [Actinomycetes bacterium]
MSHPALPPRRAWPWLAMATTAWVLALVFGSPAAPEPLPAGRVEAEAVLLTDTIHGRHGPYALAVTEGTVVLLDLEETVPLSVGEVVRVEGVASGRAGRARGIWHASAVRVTALERLAPPSAPHLVVGNSIRDRVMERLEPLDDRRGLLAGFLIGDTTGLDPADEEAMRLAGLSHFVAVSGSNVAMFLAILYLVAGPLAIGPRSRALVGLIGLPVYAAVTRFEPSVMRASVMAGLALAGKLAGIALDAWQLLSLAVVALLVVEPSLASSVGFQLSVAATAGVLVGGRWPTAGGPVARALLVTVGAQAAVAPLLVAHFGTVPVLSPLINLVAAPIVSAATITAAAGVAGVPWLVDVAAGLAGLVLDLARGASAWPQAGARQAAALLGAALVWARFRPARAPMAAGAAVLVVAMALGGGGRLPPAGAVVLDVGQGDAILLHGGDGRFALVDGGPDPVVLDRKLRDHGVSHLDLVVATHAHADHVAGLTRVVGGWMVGELWAAFPPHRTDESEALLAAASEAGVPVREPAVGEVYRLGALDLEVLGPRRRYKSPNDQSIVLLVRGPAGSMLLTGDVEAVAQAELAGVAADVLKVPHHGGGTSDPGWLASTGARLAVIPVGPNGFGHPVPWVIETLEGAGAEVMRTDRDGDVVVDLLSSP